MGPTRLTTRIVLLFALLGVSLVLGIALGMYLVAALVLVFGVVVVSGLGRSHGTEHVEEPPATWYEAVTRTPVRAMRQRRRFHVLMGTAAVIVVLNFTAPGEPTVLQRFSASFVIGLAGLSMWLWLSRVDKGMPFMPFFACAYAVYYAIPVFVLKAYSIAWYVPETIPAEAVDMATALAAAGLALLMVGYYAIGASFPPVGLPRATVHWENLTAVRTIAIVLGVVGITMYYVRLIVHVPVALQQIVTFFSDMSLLAVAILFILQLSGRLRTVDKVLLWAVLIPTRTLIGLGTGATAQGLEVGILLVFTYAAMRRRIPWKTTLVGAALAVVLIALRAEFRSITWQGSGAGLNPVGKVTVYVQTVSKYLRGRTEIGASPVEITMSRLGSIMTFADVIRQTPDSVPYWSGDTYYPLLLKPIPRMLFPGKPKEVSGQTFGHRYGFLHPTDRTTSFNLPQLIELYANFGMEGILLGMPLLGMAYRWVHRILVHKGMGLGALLVAIYLMTRMLLMESALSQVVGGVFYGLLFMALLHFAIRVNLALVTRRPASGHPVPGRA